ncbi:ubiquitin-like autophagy protein Apg12-domain-containing protein [Jimgerdemannia flammicorona]|uniref:Ubiquitin-like protein ATG12 n=1 Tax=Jimgerdemannia flammicorona TaxID=994334 RepID=A0A433QW63_9FUNG|nr:ubiquitin-like autophagy protein Apg12-domain-containing protein [Jimgerdemannia flammicorona]
MNSPQLPPLQSPSVSTATTSSFSLTPAETQLPFSSTTAPALPASSTPKSPDEVVAALKKKDISKGVKCNLLRVTCFGGMVGVPQATFLRSCSSFPFDLDLKHLVVVRFRAIGNAPIMKQNFYKITASNKFQAVIQFLRKELNYKGSDPLFLYINSAFSPAPDEIVSNLHKVRSCVLLRNIPSWQPSLICRFDILAATLAIFIQ